MTEPGKTFLIAGGGIAGLTAAIALQQLGLPYLVLEAVPQIRALGAGITLAGNAMKVLHHLGIDADMRRAGYALQRMVIQDDRGRPISSLDPSRLKGMADYGNVAIHRGALHEVLLSHIPATNIRTGKKIAAVQSSSDGVCATTSEGEIFEGQALLAADGIHSAIRQQLLPKAEVRYAGYTCWRGIAAVDEAQPEAAYETWGAKGRFGFVPITPQAVYWFACVNANAQDQRLRAFKVADVRGLFKNFCDPIPDLLQRTPEDQLIWSDIIDLKPIHQFAFDKVLLLGDAAHATTPNLGQGACQGIEDAATLQSVLKESGDNIPQAFCTFEKLRLKRAHYIVNTSHQLGRLAQWSNPLAISLRNTLLRTVPDTINERQSAKILGLRHF